MKNKSARFSVWLGMMVISIAAAAADPSLHEVYQQVQAGKLQDAQSMMEQVLRSHPNSAKAHFVEAEIQAKQGKLAGARAELATAEQLAPGLPFAKPAAVAELKALTSNTPSSTLQPANIQYPGSSFSWSLPFIGIALLALLIYFIRSRQQPVTAYPASVPANSTYPPAASPGGGFGYPAPMTPPASGNGSGILAGLATGAAVGAGMVAGEALMHRVLGGGSHETVRTIDDSFKSPDVNSAAPINYDVGGNDFGVNDADSWDDRADSDSWS